MSIYRRIHTKIWSDNWFSGLETNTKLLFIYLFSNETTSISGIYELPLRRIEFDTGLDVDTIKTILCNLERTGKIFYDYDASVIWVKNLQKYNDSTSIMIKKRIIADIKSISDCEAKRKYIEYQHRIDTVSIECTQDIDTQILSLDKTVQYSTVNNSKETVTEDEEYTPTPFSILSVFVANLMGIPELTPNPMVWTDGINKLISAGVSQEDIREGYTAIMEKGYTVTGPQSIINAAINAKGKRAYKNNGNGGNGSQPEKLLSVEDQIKLYAGV